MRMVRLAGSSKLTLAFVALSVFVLLLSGAVVAAPAAVPPSKSAHAPPATLPTTPSRPAKLHLPPGLRIESNSARALSRPAQSDLYYLQAGSTISQLNDSSASGVARLSEFIPLVPSPYSTAYELNGLSSTGDWWQIVVAYNWPGCNSGYEEATEIWDNLQNSGPITCDSTVSLSTGDLVELSIYFSSGGNGCLGLKDITTATTHNLCSAQPDSGATTWSFLNTAADGNGYYTGTMTEVVNTTASACPDYLYMPDVKFEFANGTFVTQYIPWSDEFDLLSDGSRTLCYVSNAGTASISPGDPASQYVDTATGTSYGPRWEDGENYSIQDSKYGFRFETDPTRLTSIALSGTPTMPMAGALVNFTETLAGGVSPFHTLWRLNGVITGSANLTWSWRAGLAGVYHVDAFGVDANGDVIGPSNVVNVTVPGPLAIAGIATTPVAGTDAGLAVTITAEISGGYGYWVFNWTGLPVGCAAANLSAISCIPSAPGDSNISVTVKDANGSQVHAGPHLFEVFATLGVGIISSATALDVGQTVYFTANVSGGSGGDTYVWSEFPGCSGFGVQITCTPTTVGPEYVFVTVNDTVGAIQLSPGLNLPVYGALSVALRPGQVLADQGGNFSIRAAVSGGAYPLQYGWYGLPLGCAPTGPVANCSLPDSANYIVGLQVTDSTGAVVSATTAVVLGHPPAAVSVSSSAKSIAPNASVTFTATASGGSAPFKFHWSGLPSGCSGPGAAEVTCAPSISGNYSVVVVATDVANVSVRASANLTVAENTTSLPPPSSSPSGSYLPLILILLIVIVAVAVAAVRARRRYK